LRCRNVWFPQLLAPPIERKRPHRVPRLVAAFSRLLLSPKRPELRLVHTDDVTAMFLHRQVVLITAFVGFGTFLVAFQAANGVPLEETRLSGWITRIGGVMSGPLPLILRLFGGRSRAVRKWAAVSGMSGSLLTRYGWVLAGGASAQDWRLPLDIPQESPVIREMQAKPAVPQAKSA
jgi:hypothetical protein